MEMVLAKYTEKKKKTGLKLRGILKGNKVKIIVKLLSVEKKKSDLALNKSQKEPLSVSSFFFTHLFSVLSILGHCSSS